MKKNKVSVNHNPDLFDDLDKVKRKSKKSKSSLGSSSEKTKHKSRDGAGQSSIISFFQTKADDVDSTETEVVIKKKKRRKIIPLAVDTDSDFEESSKRVTVIDADEDIKESEPLVEKRNAFAFMMDNRHKSIGQNSQGKELDQVEELNEVRSEKKNKLSNRKSMFQDWADRRGGKKRKIDDRDRGVVIEKKLEERSKRFKKMLKIIDKKEKSRKKNTTKNKLGSQKENDEFELNSNRSKTKWLMKVKINLNDEDADKLTVPIYKENEAMKTLNGLENVVLDKVKERKSKSNSSAQDAKVAPVFKIGDRKAKSEKNNIKARKEFLHSDVPDAIKKIIDKQQRVELFDYIAFPTVSHLTVKPTEAQLSLLNRSPVKLNLRPVETSLPKIERLTKGCVTHSAEILLEPATPRVFRKIKHLKKLAKKIKAENPDYPVYKVFKSLRGRCTQNGTSVGQTLKMDGDVEIIPEIAKNSQMWTDWYKPSVAEDIFGNQSAVAEIKTWLETWLDFSKRENGKRRNSISSSDFETDGENSRDKHKALPDSSLLLLGPHGCGKTMTVYTVCNELGINVLEVNASSKRTGKKLLMELQEATRSHQVRKNENSLNGFVQKSNDFCKAMDKTCLLLIEDIDLVFEQDDGFINALSQLLTTSKRPIILTTTDKNCSHLQKFSSVFPTVAFKKLPARLLTPWLQLVCLVEGLFVNKESIASLLENNGNDVRSTLLQLQFWSHTGGQSHDPLNPRTNISLRQDDHSNISDSKDEEDLSEFTHSSQRICAKSFQKSQLLDLDLAWRSFSSNDKTDLNDALNVLEALSTADMVYKKFCINQNSDPLLKTNRINVTDSLELTESEEAYSSSKDACCNLAKTLVDGCLGAIGRKKSSDESCSYTLDRQSSTRRSKCNDSLLEIVPLVCHLQRDSVNVDYLSTLRTINRTEMLRASNNQKRSNRFYNYLRGLGLNHNSEANFSTLSNIFSLEKT